MSQIEATKKSDLITLPKSQSGMVTGVGLVPTVINLAGIGIVQTSNANEPGTVPGLQDTYLTIYADGADIGFNSGDSLGVVTGGVASTSISAGGSGYTSAPAVYFTASTLMGGATVSAGGSGYTVPPLVTFSGGGGSGALAVAVVQGGQLTGIIISSMGGGYTSAGAITITSTNGLGSGATATPMLATALGMAVIGGSAGNAGQLSGIMVTYVGAGYGSAGAAVITVGGSAGNSGGGSGGGGTAVVVLNAPGLSQNGVGNGAFGGTPGICQRLPAGQSRDYYPRTNWDQWLGIVGASAGTVRIFRSSY